MNSSQYKNKMLEFGKSLYEEKIFTEAEYYIFDNNLTSDIGEILLTVEDYYKKKNVPHDYLSNTIKRFYDNITVQDFNLLIKKNDIEMKKEFSIKDKINYYSKRIDDNRLSIGQRNFAKKRLNELR